MNSNNWNTWRTYLEELADPQSVDTSTLLSKTSLSEDIWTKNEQLKPEILQAALRIAQEYFQDLELDPNIKIKGIDISKYAIKNSKKEVSNSLLENISTLIALLLLKLYRIPAPIF